MFSNMRGNELSEAKIYIYTCEDGSKSDKPNHLELVITAAFFNLHQIFSHRFAVVTFCVHEVVEQSKNQIRNACLT
jgi:hypothetical protein